MLMHSTGANATASYPAFSCVAAQRHCEVFAKLLICLTDEADADGTSSITTAGNRAKVSGLTSPEMPVIDRSRPWETWTSSFGAVVRALFGAATVSRDRLAVGTAVLNGRVPRVDSAAAGVQTLRCSGRVSC